MPRLSSAFVVLALGLIASIEAQTVAGPKINSPTSLTQCQPAALTWTDATPPVYISAVQGTNTAADPLLQFTPQNTATGTLTWKHVNITAGTTITLVINDGTGVNNFSGRVTIKDGDSSCLDGKTDDSSSTGSSSGSSSSGSTGSTGTTASSGTTGSTGSTGSTASTGSSNHASTSSTTTSPSTTNHTTAASSPSASSSGSTTKTTTSGATTSGSTGMSAAGNTVIVGAAAAIAGVLLATGLF